MLIQLTWSREGLRARGSCYASAPSSRICLLLPCALAHDKAGHNAGVSTVGTQTQRQQEAMEHSHRVQLQRNFCTAVQWGSGSGLVLRR